MADSSAPTFERDMARAVNLMAHPTAAFAAASAIGLGLASQAMGLWFGTVAGVMEAALRATDEATRSLPDSARPAARRARAATKVLMEDAHALAREVAEVGGGGGSATRKRRRAADAEVRAERGGALLVRPEAIAKPARPDDLKAIPGIGPKLEQVLNGLGIWTYGQIAGWGAAESGWVEEQLGLEGRIGRDEWTVHAARLAKASAGK